jgi:hypothetical protein
VFSPPSLEGGFFIPCLQIKVAFTAFILEISPMRGNTALTPSALILVLASFLLGRNLTAQPPQPFSQLDVGFRYSLNTNHEALHRYWNSHPSFEAVAVTPFYFGLAQAGIQVHPFSAIQTTAFDFTSFFIYLGWGAGLPVTQHIEWRNTFNLGNYVMLFTNPESENNDESELCIGFASQIKYRFRPRWSLGLSGSHNLVFTRKRIHLTYVSAGLNYRLETPAWLRTLLE